MVQNIFLNLLNNFKWFYEKMNTLTNQFLNKPCHHGLFIKTLKMTFHLINHPVAQDILCDLRDKSTTPAAYRNLCKRIGGLLLAHALENLETKEKTIETPICPCTARVIKNKIVFIPVLRAGLALLEPALTFVPDACVGYFGLQRNEETALPEFYYQKLPDMTDAEVFILDPMLATGGSSAYVIEYLLKLPIKSVTMVSVVCAPEGVKLLQERFPTVNIYTTALDEKLNDKKFIVPGLGDFGDRFHGTL